MSENRPSLEVGFDIVTGGSMGELSQLETAMSATEGVVLNSAGRIERGTADMIDTKRAVSGLNAVGAAAKRELGAAAQAAEGLARANNVINFDSAAAGIRIMGTEARALARDKALTEKAGEALIRQLDRETAALGQTKEEMRAAKIEAIALKSAQEHGNTDLADRLLASARANSAAIAARAEDEAEAARKLARAQEEVAQANRSAALGFEMFEAHARKMSQAARDAADAEAALAREAHQVRAALDPMFLAQQKFDSELERADRLLAAGVIHQREYAQEVQRSRDALYAHAQSVGGTVEATTKLNDTVRKTGGAMAAAAPQVQDFFTQMSMGANVFNVAAVQGGQFASQLVYMEGKAGAFGRFMLGPWGLAITGATLVLGALTKGLFEGANAAEQKEKAAKELTSAIDALSSSTRGAIQTEWEAQRATLASAGALRQKALDARAATLEEINHTRAKLSAALVTQQNAGGTVPGAAGYGLEVAARQRLESLDKVLGERQRELAKTEVTFKNAQIALIGGTVNSRLDQTAGVTREYQKVLARLNGEFQKTGDVVAYTAARGRLERQYLAEKDAIEASEKAGKAATRAQAKELREQERARKEAARDTERVAKEMAATRTSLQTALDPVAASSRDLQAQLKDIDKLRDAKMIGEDEFLLWRSEAFRKASERDAAIAKDQAKSLMGEFGADFGFGKMDFGPIQLGTAAMEALGFATEETTARLTHQADLFAAYADNAQNAARGMAEAFGEVGRALADTTSIFAGYLAQRERLAVSHKLQLADAMAIKDAEMKSAQISRVNGLFAAKTMTAQIGLYGDLSAAARGFFKEDSDGYRAATKAMQVFRAVEFALSVKSIAQDAVETVSSIFNSGARATAAGAEGVANQSKLPFPANIAAMAATGAALVAAGITVMGGFGGGKNTLPKANTGTGTVLGDPEAKSESLRRGIDALKDIDTLMLSSSREMAATLRSIDGQIGGVASLIVRAGDVNASSGVTEGFKANAIGSLLGKLPVIGGLLGGLFGSKTTVVGSGLSAGPQTLGSILGNGFDASYYSDIEKKKKFLGITTGTSYSTKYTGADAGLENQFTLILKGFNTAIAAAAGPLGESTDAIQNRLNGFVVNLGKIDLQGLTGEEIQDKLSAVFGAAADKMALAAFPGFERFQKVGEGAFETLVRVSSTVEAVTGSLNLLGGAARNLGIDAKLGLAGQFESVSAFNSAAESYFQTYYSAAEQNAAKVSQLSGVFVRLGVTLPDTLAGFRALVEAQDLTTAAGQSTYATLLQLAPAFADLKKEMEGAKSAADILAERQDLQRKILELNGDTAAIRALDLVKVDVSNRALQEQVWAIEDAQKAAQAAEQLREAWTSVGSSIEDEIKRIRGLTDGSGGVSFATAMSQFNATTLAARGGDQDAAKLLPSLSQALLKTAGDAATSRQELDRVQAQTASSLEETSRVIAAIAKGNPLTNAGTVAAAAQAAQAATPSSSSASSDTVDLRALRDEIAAMRADNNAGHAATATAATRTAKVVERVSDATGGDAFAVADAA